MKKVFVLVLGGLLLGSASIFAFTLGGPTDRPLAEIAVLKIASYDQKSATEIVPNGGRPYIFVASAEIKAGFTGGFDLTLPTSGKMEVPAIDLTPEACQPTICLFDVQYRSLANFNQAYPAGNYTGTLEIFGKPKQTFTFPITSQAFPITPTLTNWTAAQKINPAQAFTLTWNKFESPGPGGVINLTVSPVDRPDKPVINRTILTQPLFSKTTSFTIPAKRLKPATAYVVNISFVNVDSADISEKNVTRVSGQGSDLEVVIKTNPLLGGAAAEAPQP